MHCQSGWLSEIFMILTVYIILNILKYRKIIMFNLLPENFQLSIQHPGLFFSEGICPYSFTDLLECIRYVFNLLITEQVSAGDEVVQKAEENISIGHACIFKEAVDCIFVGILQLFIKPVGVDQVVSDEQVIQQEFEANVCQKEWLYRAPFAGWEYKQLERVALCGEEPGGMK